jgi:hypothetical protein
MANIRVTCPECKSELELDAAFEGQEVECGNCLKVFKASRPGSGGPSSSGPGKIPGVGPKRSAGSGRSSPGSRPAPQKRRGDENDDGRGRRRRDDDDDYEHDRRREAEDDDDDYGPPPYRPAGEGDGTATAAMVMGIISLVIVCCWPLSLPLAIAAIVCGVVGQKSRTNKGMATAGIVLGVLTLCMAGGFFLFVGGNVVMNPGRFN